MVTIDRVPHDDYTPSTDVVRAEYWEHGAYRYGAARGDEFQAEFDRWLAAHEESVRAEERERIARNIEALPDAAIPGYFATRPGGYVTRTLAASIAREGA